MVLSRADCRTEWYCLEQTITEWYCVDQTRTEMVRSRADCRTEWDWLEQNVELNGTRADELNDTV